MIGKLLNSKPDILHLKTYVVSHSPIVKGLGRHTIKTMKLCANKCLFVFLDRNTNLKLYNINY